jgi:predicted phosphate transport protein (TIGR00153 family)
MRFLPKEEKFYQSFLEQTTLSQKAAVMLYEACRNNALTAEVAARLSEIEGQADRVLHSIHIKLHQTFITPIDPEDIHSLASHLDDVLDYLEDAAHCLVAYKVNPIPQPVTDICACLVRCTAELTKAFQALSDGRSFDEYCVQINHIEAEVDVIERNAVAELFDREENAIQIMKLREVYDLLERTTDACEDVADVLQNVAVKNG